MENEKKENKEENSKKKKFSLAIDYSKFQNNFMNSKKKEEAIEKNKNEEKNNQNQSTAQKAKNYDQFLNMSEILNENNISQSSLNENETSKNKIEINNSKYRNNKISNFDNFSMESDEQNLLLSYNELTMSYNDNKRSRLDTNFNNKIIKDAFNKTTLHSYKKKKNYVKFINKNNLELSLSNTVNNNKNKGKEKISYAKLSAKNRLFKEKKYRNQYAKKNGKMNLFNEINPYNFNNNSVLTLSDISNVPSTTTTVDFITGNNSKSLSSKNISNYQVNKTNYISNYKNNNSVLNQNNKNNQKKGAIESKYHSVNELKEIYSHHCITKRRKKSHERTNSNLMLYVNKSRPVSTNKNSNNKEKDDLIYLLDNIKTKYKNQENKFINQQKNMKSEIEILREFNG